MLLTKEQIMSGLKALDLKAREAGLTIDIAIYGGASLALAFNMRNATRDVDAVIRGNHTIVRKAVEEIGRENNWPADWLNDGVKGFISSKESLTLMQDFQGSPQGGVRIYVPTPEYLLAMKCMAMRLDDPDADHDVKDIKNLAKLLNINTSEQFFSIIQDFYPPSRISPKTTFGVEEIAQQIKQEEFAERLSKLSQHERIALAFIIKSCDLTTSKVDFDHFGSDAFRVILDEIALLQKRDDHAIESVIKSLSYDTPWPPSEATAVSTALARHPGAPTATAKLISEIVAENEKARGPEQS